MTKRRFPVVHQRLFLASIDQHVTRFVYVEGIAQNLAATDMCTKLYQRFIAVEQPTIVVQPMIGYLELMACIHGKLVNDRLSENAMVTISGP